MKTKNTLKNANEKLRSGNLKESLRLYELVKAENPGLQSIVDFNIGMIKRKLQNRHKKLATPQSKLLTKISNSRKKITDSLLTSIHSKELTLKILEKSFIDSADFDNAIYLSLHPDIEIAIADGVFDSAKQHFEMFGKAENRSHSFQCYIDKLKEDIGTLKRNFANISAIFDNENWPTSKSDAAENQGIETVPFYLENSSHIDLTQNIDLTKIGVHLHLYYLDQLENIAKLLNNITLPFDILISTPHDLEYSYIERVLTENIRTVMRIDIRKVPNRGRDIAPMIIEFGRNLQSYDVFCHIHTKKSEHSKELAEWGNDIFDSLLGSEESVRKIITLLKYDAKVVYPEGQCYYMKDPTGWADNYVQAKQILHEHLDMEIGNYPVTEFPEGSMFWARTDALSQLLDMPLEWEDFPEEPIPTDGTLAHAIERIILISASKAPGRNFKLLKQDYINDKLYFEEKKSYAKSLKEKTIKIMSFYLPQFHPIPENDEWHGKGFTEWTKVRASTPLYSGHYQQHIPHSDIGYYLLSGPDILKTQAKLMHDAGVHGQIFYHYWFTGKLILEEPVKILLENKNIDMPFCFCWANENWTKRWDGNDSEVLLAQEYSDDDAQGFIEYLIPFLKDERYIKIDGRPVLYIYRPSSMPDPKAYIDIWNTVCAANNLPPLYITAILTRGAHHPSDYGMDGALERVLHDWTAGNVPEIKESVSQYWPVNGSILDYTQVADYYSNQIASKDFDYYRSLVPAWDNTPRYGSEAFIINGSTPEQFQAWLEATIHYTKENLPKDRHIIVVNAWNEWAEGAHLEPDTAFGYAYLNSIGRAMSGIEYAENITYIDKIKSKLTIEIEIPEYITHALKLDEYLNFKFFKHLSRAIKISKQKYYICNHAAAKELSKFNCQVKTDVPEKNDGKIQFRKISLISEDFLLELIKTHLTFRDSVIISNEYGADMELLNITGHDSVTSGSAYINSVIYLPVTVAARSYKVSYKARSFSTKPSQIETSKLPAVTTIIRFHKNDSIAELQNALMSLSAVHSCTVTPLICAQDLQQAQLKELRTLCNNYSYEGFSTVRLQEFNSHNGTGDIRAKLLHEGLKAATTRYVAFLDHDDLMMSDSYSYLLSRLSLTDKAASFGRVFDTKYESKKNKFIQRNKTYEYGFSYEDFLEVNHAPLHSFLIDKSKLQVENIKYFEDQKFMEDYYLTLQVFDRDNTDWKSLDENQYIGDYIHCTDRTHTLAITDHSSRGKVVTNADFERCKARIDELKAIISLRTFSVE